MHSAALEELRVLIPRFQGRLYAYVLSLVGCPEQAQDVLQEANLVLWAKAAEYRPGSDFAAWAYSIAHYQVLAQRKRLGRERLVFDDQALQAIESRAAELGEDYEERQAALRFCLTKLSAQHADLIGRYYSRGQSIKTIAAELDKSANAVTQALFRARAALLRCLDEYRASSEGGRS